MFLEEGRVNEETAAVLGKARGVLKANHGKKTRFPVSIFSHHFLRKSLKSHTQNGKVPVWDPVLLLSSWWPLGQLRNDRNDKYHVNEVVLEVDPKLDDNELTNWKN